MDDYTKDKRFSHVTTDPRFKKLPRGEYKVKIDKRFQSMFTDKKFQLNYAVDKRGRPVNESQAENYKKYYDISDSDKSDDDGDDEEENEDVDNEESEDDAEKSTDDETKETGDKELSQNHDLNKSTDESDDENKTKTIEEKELESKKMKEKEISRQQAKLIDELHKTRMNDTVRERLQDMSVDYARGIGEIISDSSSDEPTSEESDSELIEHPWGELDKDAETTEEITKRLAVCHMDWDRISAKDLMVLFHSFMPAEGVIESITIYPSEFGLERLKEEELKGPKELVDDGKVHEFEDDDFKNKHSEGSTYHMEKLREYQLKRLKYYYAVIVCNTPEAANKIYTECDGMEYESSATKIDLRFIPDDMTFDHEPKEVCTTLPDITKYKPHLFANSALQQGKVALTWDETDRSRIEFNKKLAGGDQLNDDDFRAFIAASSDSDDGGKSEKEESSESEEEDQRKRDPISKYKSLLADISEKERKKNEEAEMEISWGADSLSTKVSKAKGRNQNSDDSDEDNESSGDEIGAKPKKKNKKDKPPAVASEDNNAELELLLADEEPEENKRSHFNLKDIQKQEKMASKKKKWRKELKEKKEKSTAEDDFKVDLKDDRFTALYTSHHFNIDPTDPHFRKTKGINEFIEEKQKRRKLNPEVQVTNGNATKPKLNPELSSLIKSIKQKSKT